MDNSDFYAVNEIHVGDITIRFYSFGFLNPILASTNDSFLQQIQVINTSTVWHPEGEMTVRLESYDKTHIANEVNIHIPELPPRESLFIGVDTQRVNLPANIGVKEEGTLAFEVKWADDTKHVGSYHFPIVSDILWLYRDCNAPYLAKYIEVKDPIIQRYTRLLKEQFKEQTGTLLDAKINISSSRASLMAKNALGLIRSLNIKIDNPKLELNSNSFTAIQYLQDTLSSKVGSPLDLCNICCAILENLNMCPVLIFANSTVYAGYWNEGKTIGDPLLKDDRARDLIATYRIAAFNLNNSSYGTATNSMLVGPEEFSDSDTITIISIADCRNKIRAGKKTTKRSSSRSRYQPISPAPKPISSTPKEVKSGLESILASAKKLEAKQSRNEEPNMAATPVSEEKPTNVTGKAKKTDTNLHLQLASSDIILPDFSIEYSEEFDSLEVVETADASPQRVQRWKNKLLDLSLRNRLLNLKPSNQVLEINLTTDALAILDDLISTEAKLSVFDKEKLTERFKKLSSKDQELDNTVFLQDELKAKKVYGTVTENKYEKVLSTISRTAKLFEEETGNANLYLALGMLEEIKEDDNDTPTLKAPLFLLPIRFLPRRGNEPYKFTNDYQQIASPNYCLIEWLKQKYNVVIPSLSTPPEDDAGIDIALAMKQIISQLSEKKLNFRIKTSAYICIARFSTYDMWKDMKDSWEEFAKSPIVNHLIYSPEASFVDNGDETKINELTVNESELILPLPADGTQQKAVYAAGLGKTFVLEGPPGTGKSQTITNLLAHCMQQGKTVLFVAEKQAALDVVKRRIKNIGLSDFTLDLHGKNQSIQSINSQLLASMNLEHDYLPDNWEKVRKEYTTSTKRLQNYPTCIHETNSAKLSLWSSYQESIRIRDLNSVFSLPANWTSNISFSDLNAKVEDCLEKYITDRKIKEGGNYRLWKPILSDKTTCTSYTDYSVVLQALAQCTSQCLMSPIITKALNEIHSANELNTLISYIKSDIRVIDPTILPVRTSADINTLNELVFRISNFQNNASSLISIFNPVFLESGDYTTYLRNLQIASTKWIGKTKHINRVIISLSPVIKPGCSLAGMNPDILYGLLNSIQSFRNQAAELTGLLRTNPILAPYQHISVFDPYLVTTLQSVIALINQKNEFSSKFPGLELLLAKLNQEFGSSDFMNHISALPTYFEGIAENTRRLGIPLKGLVENHKDCLNSFNTDSSTNDKWFTTLIDNVNYWISNVDSLKAILAEKEVLLPLYDLGLEDFADALINGDIDPFQAEETYQNSTVINSLEERKRYTNTENFDKEKHNHCITRYKQATKKVRKLTPLYYTDLIQTRRGYSPGNYYGTYRELHRKLKSRRNSIAGFRKLISQYPGEILETTPCVFVSPASLAKFIPAVNNLFDLVVFDEASQITVEQAIGALGRARAAIIVGDSQQMPPTSFAKAVYDEEQDDYDIPDMQSLLSECVESGLPRLWLSWHYRSKHEGLISFSNRRYYENKLHSFPSPMVDGHSGIKLKTVRGQFARKNDKPSMILPDGKSAKEGTNFIESCAVISEIQKIVTSPDYQGESIGVVTFNAPQQNLILDLLEQTDSKAVIEQMQRDDEAIFVKNLENVQGDERDIIIFSTAFSKPSDGGKLPLNFGPLNNLGGEKRFNVAITRARKQNILISSFTVSDIDLARTSSKGLMHLREYMEQCHSPLPATTRSSRSRIYPIITKLANELDKKGYITSANYGLSDYKIALAVRSKSSPNLWQIAILLDGPNWANLESVADRDGLPDFLTDQMGWSKLIRIWTPELINDFDRVVERIINELEEIEENENRAN